MPWYKVKIVSEVTEEWVIEANSKEAAEARCEEGEAGDPDGEVWREESVTGVELTEEEKRELGIK